MAKNSVRQIEQDEKKILDELSKNANKSINDIAEKCGFSRQKVWRVIRNMEKNHTIWGYVAVLDEEKLDKKSYIMIMKRTNKPVSQELLDHIIKRERANEVRKMGVEITNSIFLHGSFDWILCFNAPNLKTAKGYIEIFNKFFEGYVSEVHLVEKMFTSISCGIENPDIEKLNDFFKV